MPVPSGPGAPAPQNCYELLMAPHRVDTHHHPYPPVYIKKTGDVLKHTTHAFYDRLCKWEPRQAIEVMDKDGIAVSVLSVSTPSVWLGDANSSRIFAREVNEAAAKMQQDHKGRFGHFAALPLPDADGSLREIEYVFDELNADGIALTTNYVDKYPGDEAFRPVFDELDRRKAVVYFHPTAASFAFNVIPNIPPPTIEFPFDTTRAIVSLLFSGTLHRCPNIKWIFSHGGGALAMIATRLAGLAKNRPELSARVPNGVMHELSKLYVDVVGVTTPGALRAVLDIVPMSHLLFGSDYPFWAPDVTIKGLAGLRLSAADLQAIERDNALKLLPGLARQAITSRA
jgi:6-methylsalicylate decarboxylase